MAALEHIYDLTVSADQLASLELLDLMAALTQEINREIAVHLNRRGQVVDVLIGDAATAPLSRHSTRRSENSLRGVRCIHTHPSGGAKLSPVDISALLSMHYDLMAAVGVFNGRASGVCFGYLVPQGTGLACGLSKEYRPEQIVSLNFADLIRDIEKVLRATQSSRVSPDLNVSGAGVEKAVLVGLDDVEALGELAELARTAGAEVIGTFIQKRPRPDPGTYIGSGKLEEIRLHAQVLGADLIIFDDELSPAQTRNLEGSLGTRIVDRTGLILDIFARRAQTREGKLQVELAQLRYLLPRLIGAGLTLSRLGGGIGTRGPGETKLETDRRRIRKRILDLERELSLVQSHRSRLRRSRERIPLPVAALVGYTNAGKSTLLNALTKAGVLAEDKLFATLDPTTREVRLPGGRSFLLTDTVGFIKKLPHHLIAAFRATLEEALSADLLIQVVDAANPDFLKQMQTVEQVLNELGAGQLKQITVFNKMDLVADHSLVHRAGKSEPLQPAPTSVEISAAKGEGLNELLDLIAANLPGQTTRCRVLLPYAEGQLLTLIHRNCQVLSKEFLPEGTLVWADLEPQVFGRVRQYIIE